MKRTAQVLISFILVVPLLAFGTVLAQERQVPEGNDQESTGQLTPQNSARARTGVDAELRKRIERRKNALKVQLDEAQKTRLQERCAASQLPLGRLRDRIVGVTVRREKVHTNLLERLGTLSEKLQAKGINTAEYDAQLSELKAKTDAFSIAIAELETAVNDLGAMDCAGDPEGFKASLEEARTLRAKVVKSAQDVRSYLKNTIKPTLQGFRQELAESNQRGLVDNG